MRWWMEMQEKRFDLEKEHFKTMEGLFSNLISVSFSPCEDYKISIKQRN